MMAQFDHGGVPMQRYVDPDQLMLEPIQGEDGWYFDSKTFKKPDGSPHHILLMTDERGVFIPDPPEGTALPSLNGAVRRVWLTERITDPLRVSIGRFRDPQNRWSANISHPHDHYKVTIEGEDEAIVKAVLRRIKEGTFDGWNEKVHADARAFLGRKRRGRPSMQGHPTDKSYDRLGAGESRRLLKHFNSRDG